MRMFAIVIVCAAAVLTSCRAKVGEACQSEDGCALGLYCDLEREVCADRGQLLKKGAAETYVYPIPPKTAPGTPAPLMVPVSEDEKSSKQKSVR